MSRVDKFNLCLFFNLLMLQGITIPDCLLYLIEYKEEENALD